MNWTVVKSFSICAFHLYDFVNVLLLDVVLVVSSLRQGGKSNFSHLMCCPCCPILDEEMIINVSPMHVHKHPAQHKFPRSRPQLHLKSPQQSFTPIMFYLFYNLSKFWMASVQVIPDSISHCQFQAHIRWGSARQWGQILAMVDTTTRITKLWL